LHLRPREHRVQIANAGHLDTFVWRARTRSVERHSGSDPIFGFLPDAAYALLELELAPGDTLVLITDGVTEAVSPEQEMFGEERLARWLERNADGSAAAILAGIFQAVADFTQGGRRADDISALVVKAG
jgi:sigma-B regulation protein RsbU (phosphoserine phosphatase)